MSLLLTLASTLLLTPHWTLQTSGVNARLRGVSAVNDRVAWASGSESTVLRTADGGATWQKLTVTTDVLDFRDIDAIDARNAYVLSIGNGPASRIYKTTDAGATWSLQFRNDDPKAFYDAMSFWDRDHGIVFGDSINGQFCVMTTVNGGRLWKRVPANTLPAALENEGAFAASGTNIAVFGTSHAWIGTGAAKKARVLRTTDRGRTWAIADVPLFSGSSAGIFSIAFRDTKHGVVVGGDYTKEKDAVDNLAVTNDGGATWTLVKGLSGYRSVVAYVPVAHRTSKPADRAAGEHSLVVRGQTLVAIGPLGADYSTDDGHTWRVLEGPGFDTLSFARGTLKGAGSPRGQPASGAGGAVGWAAGARGNLARLVFGP